MITLEFTKALERLNPEQRKAVETIDGPVMVVAGPGTGKTEVLTLRIANILLQTDTKPEQILALTFTEAATGNMRKRLASVIGAPAYRVRIQTFHSFCNDILQSYPEYFPRIVGASPITEVEATALVEEIIRDGEFTLLRPWGEPMLYVGDAIRKMEELKREGIDTETFEHFLEQQEGKHSLRSDLYHEKGAHKGKIKSEHVEFSRTLQKNKELLSIYKSYQEKLLEKRLYDWSDMIMEVLKLLEGSGGAELKLTLQENHQYILVDEHQDTNNAQNRILELLADFHDQPNMFVVGDSKQAIFRFQGASVENFLYFKKLYPKAVLIDLFRNYRSNQTILDSAHSLIPSETRLESFTPLLSKERGLGGEVNIASFKNAAIERVFIAEEIRALRQAQGDLLQQIEIAIIYRSNREAFPMAHALAQAGIAFAIESDEDLLGDLFVKKFITLLEAIHNYGDDLFLVPVLHIEEMNLPPLEAYELFRSAKHKRKTIYQLLQDTPLGEKLAFWVKESKEKPLSEFLAQVFRESGLLESMLKSRNADAFLGIERVFEEADRMGSRRAITLSDFMNFLEVLRKHNLFLKKPKAHSKAGAVRLMTAHRAKGLEFDIVFILNASEKSFGSKSNRDKLPLLRELSSSIDSGVSSLDDERRLFYVALTRAKKQIFITSHEYDESGKEILPTLFLDEIKPELKEILDTSEFEAKLAADKSILFAESKLSKKRDIDQEFVSELFYKEQFSVTALNNYLDCPWKYFYRNLLRIPYVREKYLYYGTAMHAGVEEFLRTKQKKIVEKDFLLESFEKHIQDSPLGEIEMKEALEKGRESLSMWYEVRKESWNTAYILEQAIYGVEFEGIRLSGKLDKIEFIDEYEVKVTDYKTGKVKSRNDIEGKTRESNGNLKRQLVFYKLLLDLYDDGKFNMTNGIIEFLEPNESGKIKWEEFEITPEEVFELKQTIKRVAEEITSLSFWDQYCDEKECEYCALRKLLEKEIS